MKKKIITFLMSFMILMVAHSSSLTVYGDSDLKLNALCAVLIDADTGRILYGKNPHEKKPMASTTKIMTCIIALEYGNLNDIVTFSSYASSMPKVHMKAHKGEKYRLEDLLYSLMLESHNDAAVAIAEHVGGSVEGFAKLMNEKAEKIGAFDTNFVTPNGLDDDNHYSTAYDMALIGSYAVKNKKFVEITNTKSYSFNEIDNKRCVSLNNKDAFLSMMNGAIGIKTGFTGKAGYCFVGAVNNKGHNLISAVLASGWPPNKTYKWIDTLSLMKYGVENYEFKQVFNGTKKCRNVLVMNGREKSVATEVKGELSMYLSGYDNITTDIHIMNSIKAPVTKGQKLGELIINANNEKVKSFDIYATKSVGKIDFKYCLDFFLCSFFYR